MGLREIPSKIRHVHPFADVLLVTVVIVVLIELAIGTVSPNHENYKSIIGVLVVALLTVFMTEAGIIYRRMKRLGSPRRRKEAIVGEKALTKAIWVVPVIFVPLLIATQRLLERYPSLPTGFSTQEERMAVFMYLIVGVSWLLGIVSVYIIYRFTKSISGENKEPESGEEMAE